MFTYIIETSNNEYYCGRTINIERRMKEHRKEKYPHWFCNDNRRNFKLVWKIEENFESKIKKFGVRNFMRCLNPQ